jgi:hypothetical protein
MPRIISAEAERIERELRARRAPGLFAEEIAAEFLLPDYDGRSLANIAAALCRLFGAADDGLEPPLRDSYWRGLEGVRRIVLVFLDALGYLQLLEMLRDEPESVWGRLARHGRLLPMTSVYPSTTATAVSSLLTGRTPLAHGLLGYTLWLREWGTLTEMLGLKPAYGDEESLVQWGFEPERFLPVPGLASLLRARGVRTTAVLRDRVVQGGLTRMTYRDFDHIHGYEELSDLWDVALATLRQGTAERQLYILYWGGIDGAIHEHGRSDGAWQSAYREASDSFEQRFLSKLTATERKGTLLVMMADHGFRDAPLDCAYDVDADPEFRAQLVVPFSGESRGAHLHLLRPESATRAWIQERVGDGYVVADSRDVVAAGLYGRAEDAAPEAAARLGHLHVLARGERYLDRQGKRNDMRGRHGGLSPQEMLVPWLAVRLEDLSSET